MYYPTITCICPTYGRPVLLSNAIACFLAQDYPINRKRLIVLDDLGTIRGLNIDGHCDDASQLDLAEVNLIVGPVRIYSTKTRFSSLPEKYNAAWTASPGSDIYLVWEDDDIQLPWCLKSHAQACEHHGWSHPSHVWSDYDERLHTEPVGGRFHGALGIRGSILTRIGGWPLTRRGDFDQRLIGALRATGEPGDPCQYSPGMRSSQFPIPPFRNGEIELSIRAGTLGLPSYIFRWHTGQEHGQSSMKGPDDESWYDNYEPPDRTGPHVIVPALDQKTREYYDLLTPA